MDEHAHSWIANSGRGGEPAYKPGPNGPRAPHVMHVRCDGCGARTWLSREQWERLSEFESGSRRDANLDYMSGGDSADSVREMYRDEQDGGK